MNKLNLLIMFIVLIIVLTYQICMNSPYNLNNKMPPKVSILTFK